MVKEIECITKHTIASKICDKTVRYNRDIKIIAVALH